MNKPANTGPVAYWPVEGVRYAHSPIGANVRVDNLTWRAELHGNPGSPRLRLVGRDPQNIHMVSFAPQVVKGAGRLAWRTGYLGKNSRAVRIAAFLHKRLRTHN